MSKIGRKPIDFDGVNVEIKGQEIHYKGKKASGIYNVPEAFEIQSIQGKKSFRLVPKPQAEHIYHRISDMKKQWGLNRALLANAIKGADTGFERQLVINGLGFKVAQSGKKLIFSLGFSHKIDFELPENISVEIDKTGQLLTLRSPSNFLVGYVGSKIRALRPPEPYKGTGIKFSDEEIIRKEGKKGST